MKKRILYIIAATVVLAGAGTGCKLMTKKAPEILLETGKAGLASISNIVTATGTLEASVTVEVGTQVSGKISKLYADFNSLVKKGQLIALLDTEALESTLQSSKAVLDQAKAEYEYQAKNYERYKQLLDKKLIAEQEFDEVEYSYKSSMASLNSAEASYAKNKTNLEYAYIYSPIDGIVLERNIEEGETVAASFSTPTLFTIANDLTQMEIEADVDEADIGKVRLGQRVEFTVDAFPDKTFEGEIIEIRLMPEETSNVVTYKVIINAPNPDKILMPGMTANASLYVTEKKDILTIPNRAVEFHPDQQVLETYLEAHPEITSSGNPVPAPRSDSAKIVWIETENSIYPQIIKVGETDEINYEVISGIEQGTELILGMKSTGQVAGNSGNNSQSAKSPFMPTPPGAKK